MSGGPGDEDISMKFFATDPSEILHFSSQVGAVHDKGRTLSPNPVVMPVDTRVRKVAAANSGQAGETVPCDGSP